jgi:uncharacterized SAM-binding protein YcdF (DUF218 family)
VELRPKAGFGERVAAGLTPGLVAGAAVLAAATLGLDDVAGISGLGVVPLAAGLGLLAGAAGFGRTVRVLAGALFVLLAAVILIPGLGGLARGYVRRDPAPAGPADAIVVLSASVTGDGDLSPAGADRLIAGLALYRAGVAPTVVLSRVVNPGWRRRRHFSDEDQHRLMSMMNVAPNVVILAPVGTTRAEALRAREWADRSGWKRIVLVTSPVHTRRACATFEGVGFEVTCVPSRDRTTAVSDQQTAGDRVRAFGQWVYEAIGWRVYRARGWIT